MRSHARQKGLQPVDHAAEIHGHPEVPVLVGDALEGALDADAGVVDEHVHVAEDALGLVCGGRHGLAVRHVQLDGMHVLRLTAPIEVRHRLAM
jgi:hypothetical protein